MKRALAGLAVALALIFAAPAGAVQPNEVLQDKTLEARARDLSTKLRCMVCQNQSIDESDAELARDLRVLVRDRLKAGDSDAEVIDYIVSRYGEFVLLKPRFSIRNALLWGTPVVLLVGGGTFVYLAVRRRRNRPDVAKLSAEEDEALRTILNDRE
jgi:cytochrome c-type biogenesis protein CcmH